MSMDNLVRKVGKTRPEPPERPCPWCGEKIELEIRALGDEEYDECHVRCINCGAMGPEADNIIDAIKQWNKVVVI